jgi:hypothetical protein
MAWTAPGSIWRLNRPNPNPTFRAPEHALLFVRITGPALIIKERSFGFELS